MKARALGVDLHMADPSLNGDGVVVQIEAASGPDGIWDPRQVQLFDIE